MQITADQVIMLTNADKCIRNVLFSMNRFPGFGLMFGLLIIVSVCLFVFAFAFAFAFVFKLSFYTDFFAKLLLHFSFAMLIFSYTKINVFYSKIIVTLLIIF